MTLDVLVPKKVWKERNSRSVYGGECNTVRVSQSPKTNTSKSSCLGLDPWRRVRLAIIITLDVQRRFADACCDSFVYGSKDVFGSPEQLLDRATQESKGDSIIFVSTRKCYYPLNRLIMPDRFPSITVSGHSDGLEVML